MDFDKSVRSLFVVNVQVDWEVRRKEKLLRISSVIYLPDITDERKSDIQTLHQSLLRVR